MAEEDNPFENQPLDYRNRPKPLPPKREAPPTPAVNPFLGKASWDAPKPGRPGLPSKKASHPLVFFVAGVSPMFSAILFYIAVGLLAGWSGPALIFGVVGVVLAVLMPYFYFGDHLRRGKPPLPHGYAKFLSGLLLGGLLMLMFILFISYRATLIQAVALLAVVAVTWTSTALLISTFFYEKAPGT